MKKGFIKVTDILYIKEYKIISQIFKDFRPTHIEFRHWENDVWYLYGESPLFDEVKEGHGIPQYEVIFTTKIEGGYDHKFRKFKQTMKVSNKDVIEALKEQIRKSDYKPSAIWVLEEDAEKMHEEIKKAKQT